MNMTELRMAVAAVDKEIRDMRAANILSSLAQLKARTRRLNDLEAALVRELRKSIVVHVAVDETLDELEAGLINERNAK